MAINEAALVKYKNQFQTLRRTNQKHLREIISKSHNKIKDKYLENQLRYTVYKRGKHRILASPSGRAV